MDSFLTCRQRRMSVMGKFPLIKCWELFIGFMSICEEKVCGRGFNIRGEEGDGRGGGGGRRRVYVAVSFFLKNMLHPLPTNRLPAHIGLAHVQKSTAHSGKIEKRTEEKERATTVCASALRRIKEGDLAS
jgi:hypothetical protein